MVVTAGAPTVTGDLEESLELTSCADEDGNEDQNTDEDGDGHAITFFQINSEPTWKIITAKL